MCVIIYRELVLFIFRFTTIRCTSSCSLTWNIMVLFCNLLFGGGFGVEVVGIGDFWALRNLHQLKEKAWEKFIVFFRISLRQLSPFRFLGRYIWYWSTVEVGTFLFIFSSAMEESLKPLLSTSCSSLVRLTPPPPLFVVVVVGIWDVWWDFFAASLKYW